MSSDPLTNLNREQIRQLQLERLQMTLNRAYFNVEFYHKRMDSLNLLPEDVSTFDELQQFPFTVRQDLIDHYPYGLFATPLKSIVRLKVASPDLHDQGKPVVIGYTRHDVSMWESLMVRLYEQVGIGDRDIIQVAYNFGLFPGAFTFNQAAERLGATLAPSATISATLQLRIMEDFRSTVLATTAAFALHMANMIERQSIDPASLHLKLILLGPDPLHDITRDRLEAVFKVPVYGLYGVNEIVEPGIAGECIHKKGLHLAEDQFLAEVVEPLSGRPVPAGQEGELVLTTLTAEAYPLIRYRTGDITILNQDPCPCGRSSTRISPILRRTDSRVTVRGISICSEQIEDLLKAIDPDIEDIRLVVHTSYGMGESLDVLISRRADVDPPGMSRAHYLEKLRAHLRRSLGLGVRLQLTDTERLPKEGMIRKTVFVSSSPLT